MKTYEEYEKEYEQIVKQVKPHEMVVKKEIWIGFKLTEDENKVPAPTTEFVKWLKSLDERLIQCVRATIELANEENVRGCEKNEIRHGQNCN